MGIGILLKNYGSRLLKLTDSKELPTQVLQCIANRARVSPECSHNNTFQGHMAQIARRTKHEEKMNLFFDLCAVHTTR